MVREPAVAGQFYPGSEEALRGKIEECFLHELGPGEIPEEEGNSRDIKGAVAPHAGYEYSGPVAAHTYKALYEDGFPETFIIIGPNHRGFGTSPTLCDQDFKTPLGKVKVDKALIEELAGDHAEINNTAHSMEHSLEVQIPFLQYLNNDFKLVPITMSKQDYPTSESLGKKIKESIENKDVVIIASTDFSHYVKKDIAREKDKEAIDKIINNDAKGLFNTVRKKRISMCGYGPVASMMIGSSCKKGELFKYATSGDVTPMREVVGYASMICR